jgi:hypothetical protein
MSIFKTRRDRGQGLPVSDRAPARFDSADTADIDPATATVEGVSLDRFVMFVAMVGRPNTSSSRHEVIAQALGFPEGRFDLIRNAWMAEIYSSPTLAREFGERLDAARQAL